MELEDWIDFSNYSLVPTLGQVDCFREQGVKGAIVGLQDTVIAAKQIAAFGDLFKETYVDLPGRALWLAPYGSIIWIDVEKGCFQRAIDVRAERDRIREQGNQPGIYTNQGGMAALGFTTEFSDLPLWYANPDLIFFDPFCGWTEMFMWQNSSTVHPCGFGVDMNKRLAPAPPPPPIEPAPPPLWVPNQTDVLWALSRIFTKTMEQGAYADLFEDDKRVIEWLHQF